MQSTLYTGGFIIYCLKVRAVTLEKLSFKVKFLYYLPLIIFYQIT